jgi:hypothetical protein
MTVLKKICLSSFFVIGIFVTPVYAGYEFLDDWYKDMLLFAEKEVQDRKPDLEEIILYKDIPKYVGVTEIATRGYKTEKALIIFNDHIGSDSKNSEKILYNFATSDPSFSFRNGVATGTSFEVLDKLFPGNASERYGNIVAVDCNNKSFHFVIDDGTIKAIFFNNKIHDDVFPDSWHYKINEFIEEYEMWHEDDQDSP